MRDDSGTLCVTCWHVWTERMGEPVEATCSVCGVRVTRYASLHLRGVDTAVNAEKPWRLCPPHTADVLNELRTVLPKFDRDTFRLPLQVDDAPDGSAAGDGDGDSTEEEAPGDGAVGQVTIGQAPTG
jgi:hypothetical protein